MAEGQFHLSFNISETRHATKNVLQKLQLLQKVPMDKLKNVLPDPFKQR